MLSVILIGFAIIIIAVVSAATITSRNVRNIKSISQNLYEHPFVVSSAAENLKSALYELRNTVLQSVLLKNDSAYRESLNDQIVTLDSQIAEDINSIKSNFLGDQGKIDELDNKVSEWEVRQKNILKAVQKNDYQTAQKLINLSGTKSLNEINILIDYVLDFAHSKGAEFTQDVENHSSSIISHTDYLLFLLVILVMATAFIVLWRVLYLQRELNRIATTDFLTGIPNRRSFMEMGERELRRSIRYGNHFALAVVDLDLFKKINDTYGHQVGDVVLKQFCRICEKDLRETDILGRIGGEEFAIMLPNTSLPAARDVIERIRANIEKADIQIEKGKSLHFTASFGLTKNDDIPELELIFKSADQALYQAKETGRNKVVTHETILNEYQI